MSGRVTIHTDGACSGNPGPGGWGAILVYGDAKRELKGTPNLGLKTPEDIAKLADLI